MAATYNRYNEPGWAEGFNSTRAAIGNWQKDQALADLERQPYSAIGLADVLPGNQGDGQGGGVPDPAAIQTARAQRRASIMRQYGDTEDANKELSANSALGLADDDLAGRRLRNTSQGLLNTNQGLTNRRDTIATEGIESGAEQDGLASEIQGNISKGLQGLTSPDGSPRSPTEDEVLRNRTQAVAEMSQAGLFKQADAARKALATDISTKVGMDAEKRGEAGKVALSAALNGDFTGLIDFTSKYGYGSGHALMNAVPDGKGNIALTYMNNGQRQQVVKPMKQFMADMTDAIGIATGPNAAEFVLKANHLRAQDRASDAAAGASNASSAASAQSVVASKESVRGSKYDNDRRALLDADYATPDDARTPDQRARIAGYAEKVTDSRPARNDPSQKPSVKVNSADGSQTATFADGTVWQQGRALAGKPQPWVQTFGPNKGEVRGALPGVDPQAIPGAQPRGTLKPGQNGTFDYVRR